MAGPLVVANRMSGAFMHELVRVGPKRIVGEIIKLEGDTASIQCYEDTSGLGVGDVVFRTLAPLSCDLGPGIMENIFDGIQRPLQSIFEVAHEGPYIPLGADVPALDSNKKYLFTPAKGLREGMFVTGGTIIGEVYENELMTRHMIMVPPKVSGEIVALWNGFGTDRREELTINDVLLKVRSERGERKTVNVTMTHKWPVREPRPVVEKLPGREALITGQRVIDTLFPSVLGGTCAIPGAFGCGKTCISQALSKYSNTQCIIYVGCGERGNEMAEVLADFPELSVKVRPPAAAPCLPAPCAHAAPLFPPPLPPRRPLSGRRARRGHHEAHVLGGQHVQHARGGARGVDLHGHHARRVLPRHGHGRGHDG